MLTPEKQLELKLQRKCRKCKYPYECFEQKLVSYGIIKHYKCKCSNGEIIEKIIRK